MSDLPAALDSVVNSLKENLGENLYSCCLYGSTVRGNSVKGVSDINLLIVLNDSNADAHLAISKSIGDDRNIDPFTLGRRGFERSVRAFAPKFLSIQRNYRVLHGADPLKDVKVDSTLERFLCEQALRNLRLRLARAFIRRNQGGRYAVFVSWWTTPFLLRVSEILRIEGRPVANELEDRIPAICQEFGLDAQVLRDLLQLKREAPRLSETDAIALHEKVFPAIDKVLVWIENKWPA